MFWFWIPATSIDHPAAPLPRVSAWPRQERRQKRALSARPTSSRRRSSATRTPSARRAGTLAARRDTSRGRAL
eukprot:scaffold250_cov110-Isochrysis_galbana.AAC.2